MGDRRDLALFVVVFTALSAVIGWVFWSSTTIVGSYSLSLSMLAVPVMSAMLAARGFSWRRRLIYAVLTLVLYILGAIVADLTGVAAAASRELSGGEGFPSLAVILLMAYQSTFPFAMMILFVGRTPTRLWSRVS